MGISEVVVANLELKGENEISIFVICILGIIIYLDVIPIRKWYHIFKVKIYGKYTRLKIYMILVVDRIFQY